MRFINRQLVISIGLLLAIDLNSHANYSGIVLDSVSRSPIRGTLVALTGGSSTLTDNAGRFSLAEAGTSYSGVHRSIEVFSALPTNLHAISGRTCLASDAREIADGVYIVESIIGGRRVFGKTLLSRGRLSASHLTIATTHSTAFAQTTASGTLTFSRDAYRTKQRTVSTGDTSLTIELKPLFDHTVIYWDPSAPCAPPATVGLLAYDTATALTASVTVTSTADAGTGSLRAALASVVANGIIGFSPSLAGQTITLASTLTISKNVTFDGTAARGITISGNSAVRIFNINTNGIRASFFGLRMINGRAIVSGSEPGGAISTANTCVLTIRRCHFSGNKADCGGAVRAGYESITTIEDCTFSDNDGSAAHNGWSAGAVSTNGSGNLVVRRSLFVRNKGESGAAIYNLLQPVTVEKCVFVANWSAGGGAALFSDEGNNVGPGATRGGHIFVRDCWMSDNVGHEVGGALFPWTSGLDTVSIERCVFVNDSILKQNATAPAQGGAVRARGILTIRDCAFIGNVSQGQGGACWLDGDGPINVANCTFLRNRVTDDMGGCMTLNTGDSAIVNITNCTMAYNTANRACGAFWFGGPNWPITITNSIAAWNTAQDHSQDQVGYQPIDGGGNVEYPAPTGGARKVAAGSLVADPKLGALCRSGATLVLPLLSSSPAIGLAVVNKAPATDARQVSRGTDPDAGAFEYVAGESLSEVCP